MLRYDTRVFNLGFLDTSSLKSFLLVSKTDNQQFSQQHICVHNTIPPPQRGEGGGTQYHLPRGVGQALVHTFLQDFILEVGRTFPWIPTILMTAQSEAMSK